LFLLAQDPFVYFAVSFGVFCCIFVCFGVWLAVPVQVIAWKDLSQKLLNIYQAGHKNLLCHSISCYVIHVLSVLTLMGIRKISG